MRKEWKWQDDRTGNQITINIRADEWKEKKEEGIWSPNQMRSRGSGNVISVSLHTSKHTHPKLVPSFVLASIFASLSVIDTLCQQNKLLSTWGQSQNTRTGLRNGPPEAGTRSSPTRSSASFIIVWCESRRHQILYGAAVVEHSFLSPVENPILRQNRPSLSPGLSHRLMYDVVLLVCWDEFLQFDSTTWVEIETYCCNGWSSVQTVSSCGCFCYPLPGDEREYLLHPPLIPLRRDTGCPPPASLILTLHTWSRIRFQSSWCSDNLWSFI